MEERIESWQEEINTDISRFEEERQQRYALQNESLKTALKKQRTQWVSDMKKFNEHVAAVNESMSNKLEAGMTEMGSKVKKYISDVDARVAHYFEQINTEREAAKNEYAQLLQDNAGDKEKTAQLVQNLREIVDNQKNTNDDVISRFGEHISSMREKISEIEKYSLLDYTYTKPKDNDK